MNTPSKKNAISPTRAEDYSGWYQQVIKAADLAENSQVRGCMVIKPWGYAIWELIQKQLDIMFKETGHVNAYFPIFIPLSFLEKEAQHVEGFAKECAVVTHHRLEKGPDGKLIPAGPLEEPLVVRPTSETIIGDSFSRWVQSYRDLPILINQWANIVRWEMRTRLFIRTAEILWQEGHTVHATAEEAVEETVKMLGVYETFCREWLAIPVIKGVKTPDERFPGAVDSYTIEALTQDKKAIQAGTSHFLGQNFSRASSIKFLDKNGEIQYGWTTSWGMSTRMIGTLIMTHSDDDGLVLPPRIAPSHISIIPIYKDDGSPEKEQVLEACAQLKKDLRAIHYHGDPLRIEIDARDMRGGEKVWHHIKKGVPIRLEIGPRDLKSQSVFMGRRDLDPKAKVSLSMTDFKDTVVSILDEIQNSLYEKALAFRKENTVKINTQEEFEKFFSDAAPGGFALCHWNEAAIGNELQDRLKVTPRCKPLDLEDEEGVCLFSGKKSTRRVIFAKAY